MASERYLRAATATLTQNGTADGVVKVQSVKGFKVKARVLLSSNAQPLLEAEVKAIPDRVTIVVGPIGQDMEQRTDVSAYLITHLAKIDQARQKRAPISPADVDRATYDEEPIVARRTILVNEFGEHISEETPLPVSIESADISLSASVKLTSRDNSPLPGDVADSTRIGGVDSATMLAHNQVAVEPDRSLRVAASLSAAENQFYPGDPADSVRIGGLDGANTLRQLKVNSDGSLNVLANIVTGFVNFVEEYVNEFAEALAVPTATPTDIIEYTVPTSLPAKTFRLYRIIVGGENIATYNVYLNGVLKSRYRSAHGGPLTYEFNYCNGDPESFDGRGPKLLAGETVRIEVTHNRPTAGAFEATVQGLLVNDV